MWNAFIYGKWKKLRSYFVKCKTKNVSHDEERERKIEWYPSIQDRLEIINSTRNEHTDNDVSSCRKQNLETAESI